MIIAKNDITIRRCHGWNLKFFCGASHLLCTIDFAWFSMLEEDTRHGTCLKEKKRKFQKAPKGWPVFAKTNFSVVLVSKKSWNWWIHLNWPSWLIGRRHEHLTCRFLCHGPGHFATNLLIWPNGTLRSLAIKSKLNGQIDQKSFKCASDGR